MTSPLTPKIKLLKDLVDTIGPEKAEEMLRPNRSAEFGELAGLPPERQQAGTQKKQPKIDEKLIYWQKRLFEGSWRLDMQTFVQAFGEEAYGKRALLSELVKLPKAGMPWSVAVKALQAERIARVTDSESHKGVTRSKILIPRDAIYARERWEREHNRKADEQTNSSNVNENRAAKTVKEQNTTAGIPKLPVSQGPDQSESQLDLSVAETLASMANQDQGRSLSLKVEQNPKRQAKRNKSQELHTPRRSKRKRGANMPTSTTQNKPEEENYERKSAPKNDGGSGDLQVASMTDETKEVSLLSTTSQEDSNDIIQVSESHQENFEIISQTKDDSFCTSGSSLVLPEARVPCPSSGLSALPEETTGNSNSISSASVTVSNEGLEASAKLISGDWLNSTVIDTVLRLFEVKHVHLFDPTYVPVNNREKVYNQRNYPPKIGNSTTLVVPLHNNEHWTIGILDRRSNRWAHYNSLSTSGDNDDRHAALIEFSRFLFDKTGSVSVQEHNCAQQSDYNNCGIHSILNAISNICAEQNSSLRKIDYKVVRFIIAALVDGQARPETELSFHEADSQSLDTSAECAIWLESSLHFALGSWQNALSDIQLVGWQNTIDKAGDFLPQITLGRDYFIEALESTRREKVGCEKAHKKANEACIRLQAGLQTVRNCILSIKAETNLSVSRDQKGLDRAIEECSKLKKELEQKEQERQKWQKEVNHGKKVLRDLMSGASADN